MTIWLALLLAAFIGYIIGRFVGYVRSQYFIKSALLMANTLNQLRPTLEFYAHLLATIERAQAVAESFGAADALQFISDEIESYRPPDGSPQ